MRTAHNTGKKIPKQDIKHTKIAVQVRIKFYKWAHCMSY